MDVKKNVKKAIIGLLLIIITYLYFRYPDIAKTDTKDTLLLWLYEILPCQFAGMVLMGLWKSSGLTVVVERTIGPVFEKLFGCSKKAAFILICGFLFGFPAGAYAMSLTMEKQERNSFESQVLLVCANVFQPAYLLAFVYPTFREQFIQMGISKLQFILLYDGVHLGYFFVMNHLLRFISKFSRGKSFLQIGKNTVKVSNTAVAGAFGQIITNALVTSATLAGYMMFFSFLQIIRVVLPKNLGIYYCGLLEVSTALKKIMPTNPRLGLAALMFGGFSCVSQLFVPLGGEFKVIPYCIQKGILAVLLYITLNFYC